MLERPSGLSHPVNCFLHAALKSCDPRSPAPPPQRAVTRLPLFTDSNERKMFPSTLMTRRGSGRTETKLIKASVSPRHYGEFSGDAEVYLHHHFDTQSPFNYRQCFCKVFPAAGKQALGGLEAAQHRLCCGDARPLVHQDSESRAKQPNSWRSNLKSSDLICFELVAV